MAYTPTNWQPRLGTGLNKFSDQNGNTYEFTSTPDSVTQAGTPFNTPAMNNIENELDIIDGSSGYFGGNGMCKITAGGTGASSAAQARTNLGINYTNLGTNPIATGGTGGTTKVAAKTNLGITYGTADPSGGSDGDIYFKLVT